MMRKREERPTATTQTTYCYQRLDSSYCLLVFFLLLQTHLTAMTSTIGGMGMKPLASRSEKYNKLYKNLPVE